jgi:hypothetical protein
MVFKNTNYNKKISGLPGTNTFKRVSTLQSRTSQKVNSTAVNALKSGVSAAARGVITPARRQIVAIILSNKNKGQ